MNEARRCMVSFVGNGRGVFLAREKIVLRSLGTLALINATIPLPPTPLPLHLPPPPSPLWRPNIDISGRVGIVADAGGRGPPEGVARGAVAKSG